MDEPQDQAAWRSIVYDIIRTIPEGRVMTYGGVAASIPPPAGTDPASYRSIRARWVGYALKRCPDDVPWYRVVNAQGRVSVRHGLGPNLQRSLLEEEGIEFDAEDRLDIESLRWALPVA